MALRELFKRKSVYLSGSAVFAALAIVSVLAIPAAIQPAFPLFPILRFDPAEIFSVTAFLLFGPVAGFLTAIAHWITLAATTVSPRGLVGPTAKFAAVSSMLLGFWVGSKLYEKVFSKGYKPLGGFALLIASGMASRVLIMTAVSYFIYTFVGPVLVGFDYLGAASKTLKLVLGWELTASQVLAYLLLFTAIFNVIHVVFSGLPAFAILIPLVSRVPQIAAGGPWVGKFFRKTSAH